MTPISRQPKAGGRDLLLAFIKYPRPGTVKTRLARSIGNTEAAQLSRWLAERLLANLRRRSFTTIVMFTPAADRRAFQKWTGGEFILRPQRGKDLGARMAEAFRFGFKAGFQRVVAVGSDIPQLTGEVIEDAFRRLEKAGCVIGPCIDGGYYLIGLSGEQPELFQGIDWSTERVCKQTMEKIAQAGLRCTVLETLADIDTVDDLALINKPVTPETDRRE